VYARYLFFATEKGSELWTELGLTIGIAILMTRIGLAWGGWMEKIRR
jgi:cytochrome b